jgi:xyloglucan-specific exo-beta-1,4-glucanase
VPGREGDIWLAGGTEGGLYGIWHSTNGGVSFTRLASVEEADNIGFGRAAPNQSYPALYTSAQIGGVRGIYRSDNAGVSWVRINDARHQFAFTGGAITGDPRVFGRVYVGTNGRGIVYGQPSTMAMQARPVRRGDR